RWEGATGLFQQLQNPTQIGATFFEIETAAWCADRAVTRALQFSPAIDHGGRVTRPDYLWKTALGDLYCECKRASEYDDRFTRRAGRIEAFLNDELRPLVLPDVRFDFFIERTSGAEQSLRNLVEMAKARPLSGQRFVDGNVTLALVARGSPVPTTEASILRRSVIPIGTSLTAASSRGATHTLEVAGTSYWQSVAARL